jgi:hypothetical protein
LAFAARSISITASAPRPPVSAFHPFADVLAFVVDHVVGAGLARELGLGGRAHGGDHARAALLGELDRVMPDRAGTRRDQHRAAVFGAGELDRLIACIGGNAEARARVHRCFRRQRHRLLGRERYVFGGGAEGAPPLSVPDPDLLAHARRWYAVAHRIDLAGAVGVRNDSREGDLAGDAGAALHVRGVDAGGRQPHPHLTRAGARRFDLGDAQHRAGGSVGLVISSTHQRPRGLTCRGLTCPGLTSSMSAAAAMSAKAAGSAPVRNACAPSVSSSP